MICLFVSKGCSSCRKLIKDIPSEWASEIAILNVEYDRLQKKYYAYKDGIKIGEESPVLTVPTLCVFDTEEIYTGYSDIIRKLENGIR